MNATRKIKPPRVFISYSHDSPEHKAWVRELAIFLRQHGFDARLDQREFDCPPDGWPAWCSRQVVAADYILMICNETYYKKFHGLGADDFGRGVRWEGRAIQNLAYFDYLKAGCLAIVADQKDIQFVPTPLNDCTTCSLTCKRDRPWSESEVLQRLPCGSDNKPLPIPSPPDDSRATQPLANLPQDASIITSDVFQAINQIDERIRLFSDEWRQQFVPTEFNENPTTESRNTGQPSIDDLRYNRQWLDYIPQPRAERALEEFLNDSAPFLWWGVTAAGGVGKSRLAHEFVLRLRNEQGWDACFLSGDSGTRWLMDKSSGWRPRRPSLLVVDYAATRGPVLVTAVRQLAAKLVPNGDELKKGVKCFPKVRLLFLDRPAQSVPVFTKFLSDPREYDLQRQAARAHLWAPPSPPGSREDPIQEHGSIRSMTTGGGLEPLVTDVELLRLENLQPDEWPDVLRRVIRRSNGDPAALPTLDDTEFWNRVSRLTGGGRLLFLQLLGICLAADPQLHAQLTASDGLEKLLDSMLDREREGRWKDLLGQQSQPDVLRKVERALGFITLTRGVVVPKDAENVMQASAADAQTLNDVLPRIVSVRSVDSAAASSASQTQVFGPVEPDLLGERLLIRLASDTGQGFTAQPAEVDPASWMPRALLCDSMGTAATLSLLADDFPQHPTTARWITALLECSSFSLEDALSQVTLQLIASTVGKMALGGASNAKQFPIC